MQMKQWSILAVLVLLVAALAVGARAQAQTQTISGYLVDVKCGSARGSEAGFPADHTKSCMLMDACMKSGYAVMKADKTLVKFDAAGNEKAVKLLKSTNRDKDWKVDVTGTMQNDVLAVATIALQK